jgi:hypothetical protein
VCEVSDIDNSSKYSEEQIADTVVVINDDIVEQIQAIYDT